MGIIPLYLSLLLSWTIIDSVDIGDYANGVAYGSGYVWAVDNGVDHIFKIDPSDMSIVTSFSYPGGLDGLGYDGEYLWIGVWTSSIHKVDTTGTCVGTWSSPGATYSYGMAYDGTFLWHSDKNTRTIYRLDYVNPSIVYESFSVAWEPRDLGWIRGNLWATANATTIYELDPTDMSIINSWPSGRSNTAGLALGGGYLWFGSNNQDRGMVYKVDVPLGIEEVEFSAVSECNNSVLRWYLEEHEIAEFCIWRREVHGNEYSEIARIPASGNGPSQVRYTYTDRDVEVNHRYLYKLCIVKVHGSMHWKGPVSVYIQREKTVLRISPNPFSTHVRISLMGESGNRRNGEPEIQIYDLTGRLVRQFLIPNSQFSIVRIEWDGRDESGKVVSPGTYFVKVRTQDKIFTKKVIRIE
jgi:hypothetical protein